MFLIGSCVVWCSLCVVVWFVLVRVMNVCLLDGLVYLCFQMLVCVTSVCVIYIVHYCDVSFGVGRYVLCSHSVCVLSVVFVHSV